MTKYHRRTSYLAPVCAICIRVSMHAPPAHLVKCAFCEMSWRPAAADKLERRAAAVRLQVAFTGALAGSQLSVTAFVEEALHCYRSRSCAITGCSSIARRGKEATQHNKAPDRMLSLQSHGKLCFAAMHCITPYRRCIFYIFLWNICVS